MSKFPKLNPKLKNYYEHPLSNLKNDFDNLFNILMCEDANLLAKLTDYGDFLPKVNISESDHEYQIYFEVPGVEKEDLEVTLNQGTLIVKGEKKEEIEQANKQFHRMESHYGTYYREIKLPANVDEKTLKANFKNGILIVTITKAELPHNKRNIPIAEAQ